MISYLQLSGHFTGNPDAPSNIVDLAPADVRIEPVSPARLPVTGYGRRIPTQYMVKYAGRWRRVYSYQFSNAGTAYIGPWAAPIATVN